MTSQIIVESAFHTTATSAPKEVLVRLDRKRK